MLLWLFAIGKQLNSREPQGNDILLRCSQYLLKLFFYYILIRQSTSCIFQLSLYWINLCDTILLFGKIYDDVYIELSCPDDTVTSLTFFCSM